MRHRAIKRQPARRMLVYWTAFLNPWDRMRLLSIIGRQIPKYMSISMSMESTSKVTSD